MRWILVLLVLFSALPAWADDAPAPGREELRQRLLRAYRAQERVHFATRFAVTSAGESYTMHGECYAEGDRAGVRLLLRRADDEQVLMLMVTDGVACALFQGGVRTMTMEGARTLREWLAPYAAARRAIAAEFDVRIPEVAEYGVCPTLNIEEADGEPRFWVRLVLEEGGTPRWLAEDAWEDLETVLHEEDGNVELRAKHYTGRIALADGLPVAWNSRNPKTNSTARGTSAEPVLTTEAWNELIDDRCRDIDPRELTLRMRQEAAFGPQSFLRAVMKHIPDLSESADRQRAVARRLAEIELGRIAAEDAAHLDAKISRLVEDLRAMVRNHGRELKWPEAGTEAFGKAIAEALRSTRAGAGR